MLTDRLTRQEREGKRERDNVGIFFHGKSSTELPYAIGVVVALYLYTKCSSYLAQ